MTDIKEQYLEELIIYPKIAAVTQAYVGKRDEYVFPQIQNRGSMVI